MSDPLRYNSTTKYYPQTGTFVTRASGTPVIIPSETFTELDMANVIINNLPENLVDVSSSNITFLVAGVYSVSARINILPDNPTHPAIGGVAMVYNGNNVLGFPLDEESIRTGNLGSLSTYFVTVQCTQYMAQGSSINIQVRNLDPTLGSNLVVTNTGGLSHLIITRII